MVFVTGRYVTLTGCVLFFIVCNVEVNSKKPLQLLGFFPLALSPATAMYEHGNNSKISADLALKHVNARNDVLKDYRLEMIFCDSGVSMITDLPTK